MDEYLEEEIEYIKNNLNSICANWEKQVKPELFQTVALELIALLLTTDRLFRNSAESRSPVDVLVFLQSRSNEAQCSRRVSGRALAPGHNRTVDRIVWRECHRDRRDASSQRTGHAQSAEMGRKWQCCNNRGCGSRRRKSVGYHAGDRECRR